MNANILKGAAIAAFVGSLSITGVARADGWPSSIAGEWSITGNQHVGSMSLVQPSSNLNCRRVYGTIYNSDRVEGFYCPSSGRISFARLRQGTAIQYWQGNLSQSSQTLRMGGTFSVIPTPGGSGGSLGEYNFSATK